MLQTVSNSSARIELVVDQTHMNLRDMSRTMDQSTSETMVISSNVKQTLEDIRSLNQALIVNSSARTEPVINQTYTELREMSRTMNQSNSETMVISSNVHQLLQDIQGLKQALDPQKLVAELASLMQREGFRSLGEHRDGTALPQSFDQSITYANVPFGFNASSGGRKRARKRRISRTIHKVLFFDVEVTTFGNLGKTNDIQSGHRITPAITTETHIRLRFPLTQRTTSFRILREACNPYVTRTLTTYNIVSEFSPLYKAIRRLDLCEMRRLFVNGLASPRDRILFENWDYHDEITLLDLILDDFTDSESPVDVTYYPKVLDILEYLLQVAPPRSERSERVETTFSAVYPVCLTRSMENQLLAQLRLLDQYCPAEFWEDIEPQFCFDEKFDDGPIYSFIKARDGYIFDLNNRFLEGYDSTTGGTAIYFVENTRHMCEDASGSGLLRALAHNYPYCPLVRSYSTGLQDGHEIARLLSECAESSRGDLIQCCQTRITILINHGYYTKCFSHSVWIAEVPQLPITMQLMEFAIYSNTFQILHDALLNAGWTENMIQASLDDVMYAGISELFEGIQYLSRDECREEFIRGLCRGDYLDFMKDPNWRLKGFKLALSLGMRYLYEVEDMIQAANSSYSQRFIPGSWPVEANQHLVPGIDFPLLRYRPLTENEYWKKESIVEWPCVQAILRQHGLSADDVLQ
jgi:hypothetical protein